MRILRRRLPRAAAAIAAVALLAAACGTEGGEESELQENESPEATEDADGALVVYSGRGMELVGPVFEMFTEATGIEVEVREGDTAELAGLIINEGDASPADVYWGQDASALGQLEARGRLADLPDDVLEAVDPNFRSSGGAWIGVTGRVRVIAYSTERVSEAEINAIESIHDLTEPGFDGRIGWAPQNGSFQAFVTALRLVEGEDAARTWLEGMIANNPVEFANNSSQVDALGTGDEIDFAIVNHYYLHQFLQEDPEFAVENHYLPGGDIGGLVNVAGVGVVDTTSRPNAANRFVEFLVSEQVQEFFANVTSAVEYPLRDGVNSTSLPPLTELEPPEVDLTRIDDLEGTLALLRDVGAL